MDNYIISALTQMSEGERGGRGQLYMCINSLKGGEERKEGRGVREGRKERREEVKTGAKKIHVG